MDASPYPPVLPLQLDIPCKNHVSMLWESQTPGKVITDRCVILDSLNGLPTCSSSSCCQPGKYVILNVSPYGSIRSLKAQWQASKPSWEIKYLQNYQLNKVIHKAATTCGRLETVHFEQWGTERGAAHLVLSSEGSDWVKVNALLLTIPGNSYSAHILSVSPWCQ